MLRGRRIVVSGGASGIGRATTLALADDGADVAVIDLDEATGQTLVRDADGARGAISFRRADVSIEADVSAAIEVAATTLGGVDVLISTAGVMRGQLEAIAEHTEATWDEVVDTNLKGAFLVVKHAARLMLGAGRGVIILVGSEAGVVVGSGSFAYGASKGGVHGLALTLDRHLGPKGIRVNEVCPGGVDTPLYRRSVREGLSHGADPEAAEEQLRHLVRPEAVARVIAFLASEAADAVRGTVFTA